MRHLFLFFWLFVVGQIGAADWPHQRGPQLDGSVPEGVKTPSQLPDDPKMVWQVPATDGFAAPIIVGDRVIFGDFQNGKETFHGLNLGDNEEPRAGYRTKVFITVRFLARNSPNQAPE